MRQYCLFWAVLQYLACAGGPASHASDNLSFRITKIQEGDGAFIQKGTQSKKAQVGAVVQAGDRIVTREDAQVEIEAPDGSTFVIHEESDFEVAHAKEALQTVVLHDGKLIGVANKVNKKIDASNKKKYRFLVRTHAAVMGVRGTKFVVETSKDEKTASFHTLEGLVEVAKDLKDLVANNVVVVGAGKFVEAVYDGVGTAAQGTKKATKGATDFVGNGVRSLSAAMPFDVLGFLADVNSSMPAMFHIPFITGRDPAYAKSVAWFHLSSFEIGASGYLSHSNIPEKDRNLGFTMSWNPTIHVSPGSFDIRGHLGTIRMFRAEDNCLDGLEFKLLGTLIFHNSWFLESGPVIQRLFDYGTGWGVSANSGLWFGDSRIWHLFDRIYFGFSWLRSPYPDREAAPEKATIWDFRFGLGFTIF